MDVSDVLQLAVKMESDGMDRQANLIKIEKAYKGDYEDRKRRGFWRRFFGDALPLYYEDEKAQKLRIVVNLLRPMVEAKRGLIGKVPAVRVPPPGIDPEATMLAEQNEKRIEAMLRWSNVGLHFGNMGWFLPVHGDCVGYVDLDLEKERPVIGVRSTRNFYATPADLTCTRIREAVFVNTYSGRHAAEMFDAKWLEEFDDVKVYEFWNKDLHCYVTDKDTSRFIIRNENKFTPDVPLRIIPNTAIPGSLFGDSDIEDGIELVKEFNRRYSIETEAIIRTLFAPWIVKNPLKVPKEISLDPYSIIPVGEGGDVRPAQPAQIPWQWMKGKDELRQLIQFTTGTPSALTSEMDSSIVTAKAFNASLGPWNAQMDVKNQYIYPAWEYLIQLGLRAQYEIWGDKTFKTYCYTKDGSPYAMEYVGEEIQGYYENEVYLPGSSFVDAQTDFMQIQAARTDKRISRRTAMRLDPRVKDVDEELARIDEEDMADASKAASMQMAATQGMPSPAQGPASAEEDLYAAERGATGTAPAPPTAGGAPTAPSASGAAETVPAEQLMGGMGEMGMPMQMEAPGTTLSAVTRAVVDEFRDVYLPMGSKVYLMGPVLQGNIGPHSCEVYLSDMNDKATIVNHMKKNLPEIVGENDGIDFYSGKPPEGSQYIDVSPGSEGYEVKGLEMADQDMTSMPPQGMGGDLTAGLPPEIAGALGNAMGGGTPPKVM